MAFDRGDKTQDQNVSDNSVAVMAARDASVTVHGLQMREVKELVFLYLDQNFPRLRHVAAEESRRCVDEFGDKLIDHLSSRVGEEFDNRLKSPSVQASINDAVMCVARKAGSANLDILSDLVAEKVSVEEDSDSDLVLSEAIRIMEKISLNYIRFVSFVYFVRFTGHPGEGGEAEGNKRNYRELLPELFPVDELRPVNDHYLAYTGLVIPGKHYEENFCSLVGRRLGFSVQGDVDNINLKKDAFIFEDCEYLPKVILSFGFEKTADLDKSPISDISKYIAVSYLNSKDLNLKYPTS